MTPYPLHVDLHGRAVLVVGGGPDAARRVPGLLGAGADVVVVAPALCEALRDLHSAGRLRWRARDLRAADLEDVWLVHAATGDERTDAEVADLARHTRTWCVRSGPDHPGGAEVPAVVRRDDVVLSVLAAADGRTAALAADLGHALDRGALPLRRRRRGPGRVVLVGGGPGEPELLTLRGRRRLAEADVVVVDRLAPQAVLAELDPAVEVVDVGKTPGHHPVPQEEVNRLLVDAARAGKVVVRLKGGDPYVLGRGGEEFLACRAAGVPVEVVPGISSAFAVPAAAGIPVTHRGTAHAVTVLSGHQDPTPAEFRALARTRGTLVVLMGVSGLDRLAAGLLAAGREPGTPVAVVEDGWAPTQRTTTGTLADIAVVARAAGVRAPAVVVVGDVVDALRGNGS